MNLKRNKEVVVASFRLIETGDSELAEDIVADDFVNLEAADDPGDYGRNQRGPKGFLATSAWLRAAFADLRFVELEVTAENETVVAQTMMTGRHAGAFQGIAPSGKPIRQRQIHVFRVRGGKILEHRAQRDDLGLLLYLGWPAGPRPTY
jgi:ketosteroid isomerase-like protein